MASAVQPILRILLFPILIDVFGNEFLEELPAVQFIPGGEFRSADPAGFKMKTLALRFALRNVPRDACQLHRRVSVADHGIELGADIDLVRRVDQESDAVLVDIEDPVIFSIDGYGQIFDFKAVLPSISQSLIHIILLSLSLAKLTIAV
jgi:hypothetical protein